MVKTRRVAVRGIIFKDGKLLCQRLTTYRRDEAPFWCTPGGGLDMGEALESGLHREMIEETGIAPKIGKLLFVQQFTEGGEKEQMEFFFHIENPEDYHTINLAETTHGLLEIEHVEFIDPKSENILPAFLQTLDLQNHIESGVPVFIHKELN